MGRKIQNPIDCRVRISFNEGQPSYRIENVVVAYGITCEYEIHERRELPLEQNAEALHIIKDFVEEAMKQVDAHEEIPEGESLLNYSDDHNGDTNGASG